MSACTSSSDVPTMSESLDLCLCLRTITICFVVCSGDCCACIVVVVCVGEAGSFSVSGCVSFSVSGSLNLGDKVGFALLPKTIDQTE